ncbi:hypothetical protein EV359DRAFT_68572 [Lentinula novae-zelandiae]|nr:hypothetical protein EV359DRAFT_68572 [Lentinula novae-zelandiae]
MMLLQSCSLCLLFIGILLSTTSVIGSPITDISRLERRGRTVACDVRIGYYRTSKADDPVSMGWVQKSQKKEQDIKCICFGIENANCFGLLTWPDKTKQVLHVTALKMRPARQSMPDAFYFVAQKQLSFRRSVLAEWKLQGYATVWDLLNDIPKVQEQMGASSFLVDDQESYIELIKKYLIMVGIIVEKSQ